MKIQMDFFKTKENRQHSSTFIPFSLYECRIPEYYANVPMHWHSEFELNYITEGNGQILLNGEKYPVSKGDILLIPPNTLHAAYSLDGSELIYNAFVFNHSALGTGSNDRSTVKCIYPLINGQLRIDSYISKASENYPEFQRCLEQILSCARQNEEISDLLLKSELLRLFWLLEKGSAPAQRESSEIMDVGLIRPAIAYMAEHYRENITVDQLAAHSHLSKSYFMSCFKRTIGISAIEHLTQLRIMAACEALVNTRECVAEIAYQCGYNNLSNFNRQFKKVVGSTPNDYRKSCQTSSSRSLPQSAKEP